MEKGLLTTEGMTEKYADLYLDRFSKDCACSFFPDDKISWSHNRGFSCFFSSVYQLTDDTYKDYISDYMIHMMFPFNSWESIWINDKLTLRYILDSSRFRHFIPKYYYYSDKERGLIPLPDLANINQCRAVSDVERILNLLSCVSDIACKPNNGGLSHGFFRLSLEHGTIKKDGMPISCDDLCHLLHNCPNYIFMEFLHPSPIFAPFFDCLPTIKIWTVHPSGEPAQIDGSIIRLSDNVVEYNASFQKNDYMIYGNCDLLSGECNQFKMIYPHHSEGITHFPGTSSPLNTFLPEIASLSAMVKDIASHLSAIEYMEFDVAPTNEGYKLIEINSFLSDIGMQLYRPLSNKTVLGYNIRKKLREIQSLSPEEKLARSKRKR